MFIFDTVFFAAYKYGYTGLLGESYLSGLIDLPYCGNSDSDRYCVDKHHTFRYR